MYVENVLSKYAGKVLRTEEFCVRKNTEYENERLEVWKESFTI